MLKVIQGTERLNDMTVKMVDFFKSNLEKEASKLGQIEERKVLIKKDHSVDDDLSEIKRKFGKVFYGVLKPINGVSPKNRRYSDGSWKLGEDYRDIEGPAVWKLIGDKCKWSTRINWFGAHEVFDKLTQEHIDLIENGTVNRKQQEQMGQDLYDALEYMRDRMKQLKDIQDRCDLSKIYDVDLLICPDREDVKAITKAEEDRYDDEKSYKEIRGLPIGSLPAKIKEISLEGTHIKVYPQMSSSDEQRLKDEFNIDTNYSYNRGVKVPLVDVPKYPSVGEFNWNERYYVIGIDKIFKDPMISTHFHTALRLKKEIIDKFDDINTTYSPYLLANGVF